MKKFSLILMVFVSFVSPNLVYSIPDKPTTELEGRWVMECLLDKNQQSSIRLTLEAQERSLKEGIYLFNDPHCTNGLAFFEHYSTFEIGNPVVGIEGAKDLNTIYRSTLLTLQSDEAIEFANHVKLCDLEDWKLYEGKEITGRNCSPHGPTFSPKNTPFYNIFKIENQKQLMLGDPQSGTLLSPEERPTRLQEILIYRKVRRVN